jgi:hypothetical protein
MAPGYVVVEWFVDPVHQGNRCRNRMARLLCHAGPALIAGVKALHDQRPRLSLRDIAA